MKINGNAIMQNLNLHETKTNFIPLKILLLRLYKNVKFKKYSLI